MKTQRVRCWAENFGSLSEKGIFLIAAIRKNSHHIFSFVKLNVSSIVDWLKTFLIIETDITLTFILWAQSGMLIIQLRMIFWIFHCHVEWTVDPLFSHIDSSALTIAHPHSNVSHLIIIILIMNFKLCQVFETKNFIVISVRFNDIKMKTKELFRTSVTSTIRIS